MITHLRTEINLNKSTTSPGSAPININHLESHACSQIGRTRSNEIRLGQHEREKIRQQQQQIR